VQIGPLEVVIVLIIALLIFGLGMVSLILNADIVEAPGLGQLPGVFATTLTTGVFALVLWFVVRLPQPRYRGALSVAVACYLAYVGGIWIGVLFSSGELGTATAVAGRIATTWFGLVGGWTGPICIWTPSRSWSRTAARGSRWRCSLRRTR